MDGDLASFIQDVTNGKINKSWILHIWWIFRHTLGRFGNYMYWSRVVGDQQGWPVLLGRFLSPLKPDVYHG